MLEIVRGGKYPVHRLHPYIRATSQTSCSSFLGQLLTSHYLKSIRVMFWYLHSTSSAISSTDFASCLERPTSETNKGSVEDGLVLTASVVNAENTPVKQMVREKVLSVVVHLIYCEVEWVFDNTNDWVISRYADFATLWVWHSFIVISALSRGYSVVKRAKSKFWPYWIYHSSRGSLNCSFNQQV